MSWFGGDPQSKQSLPSPGDRNQPTYASLPTQPRPQPSNNQGYIQRGSDQPPPPPRNRPPPPSSSNDPYNNYAPPQQNQYNQGGPPPPPPSSSSTGRASSSARVPPPSTAGTRRGSERSQHATTGNNFNQGRPGNYNVVEAKSPSHPLTNCLIVNEQDWGSTPYVIVKNSFVFTTK